MDAVRQKNTHPAANSTNTQMVRSRWGRTMTTTEKKMYNDAQIASGLQMGRIPRSAPKVAAMDFPPRPRSMGEKA